MSALAPGLYRATVRGVPDTIVMLTDTFPGDVDPWVSLTMSTDYRWHRHEHVTDARPLIVLDLDDWHPVAIAAWLSWVRDAANRNRNDSGMTRDIASQIEAQTKPARIEEPGLWGVVEASAYTDNVRRNWTRIGVSGGLRWITLGWPIQAWDVLTDPILIREGLT